LVIYKPDRVARSMKELLEDDLHAKDINLHILTGDLRRAAPAQRRQHRGQDAVSS
jgi:hypothetical protein